MKNERCTRIYKYRSLSGEHGREAIEHALKRNELYWQSPAEFNDPFDCSPVFYFGKNAIDRKKFHKRAADFVYKSQPRTIRRQSRQRMNRVPAKIMEEKLREEWKNWLAESSVTCFSEVPDHPLMWGHYADSHKGVCLIFDEIVNPETEWFALPVKYQEKRPLVNLTRINDPSVMMEALFLKSTHWSYEYEQRMLEWRQEPGYRAFPEQALKGIIFGAKIGEDDESFVRKLLAIRPNLEVLRAAIDPIDFKLNILPI